MKKNNYFTELTYTTKYFIYINTLNMKNYLFLFIIFLSFVFISCGNNYDKAIELLKERQYELALEEFRKVDNTNEKFYDAKSKIFFINGMISYDAGKYDLSIANFNSVSTQDIYKKEADEMVAKINNIPIYIYNNGVKEFNLEHYQLALKEFNKLPKESEEYQKSQAKTIFSKASELLKIDELDSALALLGTIDKNDEIYSKVDEKINYIIKKKDFIRAKEYYNEKKYSESLELLNKVEKNEEFYNEAKDIINKIEEVQEIKKYEIIKNVGYIIEYHPNSYRAIRGMIINNKKYNYGEKKELMKLLDNNNFKLEINFSKISLDDEGNIYFHFEDNKKLGSDNIRTDWDNPYGGKGMHGTEVIGFYLDLGDQGIYIKDKNIVEKIKSNKNKYKLCIIYKVVDIQTVDESDWNRNEYFKPYLEKYFIIDEDNNEVIYKSEINN
ncbi:MAG TPA: hypothetical protein VIK14_00745 [Ignavibacteria bacterium]